MLLRGGQHVRYIFGHMSGVAVAQRLRVGCTWAVARMAATTAQVLGRPMAGPRQAYIEAGCR